MLPFWDTGSIGKYKYNIVLQITIVICNILSPFYLIIINYIPYIWNVCQSSTLETMLYFSEYLLVLPRLIIVCCEVWFYIYSPGLISNQYMYSISSFIWQYRLLVYIKYIISEFWHSGIFIYKYHIVSYLGRACLDNNVVLSPNFFYCTRIARAFGVCKHSKKFVYLYVVLYNYMYCAPSFELLHNIYHVWEIGGLFNWLII